jgi:hypothetical protein
MCDEGAGATPALNVSPSAQAWYESLLRGGVHVGTAVPPTELVEAGLVDPVTGAPGDRVRGVAAARMRAAATLRSAQVTVTEAFVRSVRPAAEEPTIVRRVHPSHAVRVAVARSHHARQQVRLMDGPRDAPPTAARIRLVTRLPVGRFRVLHRGHQQQPDAPLPPEVAAHTRFGTPSPIRFLLLDDPDPTAWLWHEPPTGLPTAAGRATDDAPSETLCTTSAPVLRMLRTLFDAHWDEAAEAPAGRGRTTDRDVLAALTAHRSDDEAARALGISVRTFARRVHDLMASHGCTTRFQLALTVGGAP